MIKIFYYFCIMKNCTLYITIFVVLIFFCRCANIVTPTGGPKDETPPVVTETSPKNNSTNFKGRSVHITFDEFVTLNNPSNNVLISPPMGKKPTYRTSGKTLIIRFEEPLKHETTYSINFGNAIKDLHEGNVFSGYTFNFSTGDKIDSLSLKGKVVSASTLAPMESFIVGLYSDDNDTLTLDSLPYRIQPNYITITNKEGNFEFSGLANKEYLIFALKDSNSNLIFDLPNEEIAFHSEMVKPYHIDNKIVIDTIKLDSITDTIVDSISKKEFIPEIKKEKYPVYELFSFIQEDSIQKIFKKELVEEGLLRFVFRYPAQNVSITALEELPDTFNIMPVYSARKDTVLWYFTPNKDSLLISINDNVNISDTTNYSLKPRESVSRRRSKQEESKTKHLAVKNNLKSNKLKPHQPLVLTFSEPIIRLNERDTTWFIVDKDTIFNDLHFKKIDEYGFKYQLDKTLEPEKKYQIVIPDSTFFGFRGFTNDTLRFSFNVQEESQFGNVYLIVEVPENVPQVIVELTDEKGKVIDKQIITKTQEISFEYLDPAKYKLKATLDLDANGEWSPGNFNKKLQPEKIIFYDGTLEVRANWDIDLDEPWKLEN
mgnify:CR=1 FL=1